VDTQGAFNDRSTHLPLYYKNCSLISNRCNIRFGDEYGQGSNHRFINCKIVKTGNHPHYQTFEFDGHSSVFNHVLLDCEFTGGAKYNDVRWTDTQSLSNYRVEWTLTLETASDAIVSISDKNGNEAFTGNTGKDGEISIPLVQSIIRPVEWGPDKEEVEVTNKLQYSEERFSPYTVKVEKDGKQKSQTFLLKEKTDLKIQF
jgi:hypothetical protein